MIRARSGTEIPAGSTRYRNDGILSRAMRSMGALAGATLTSGRATWTPFVDPTVLPRIGTSRARGRIGPALLAEPISAKLAAVRVAPHWPQRAQPQPTPAPPGGLDETDGFDQGGPSVAGPAPVQHVALDGRDLRTRLADHETDVAGLPIGATCLSRPDRSTSLKATRTGPCLLVSQPVSDAIASTLAAHLMAPLASSHGPTAALVAACMLLNSWRSRATISSRQLRRPTGQETAQRDRAAGARR
jgi:hypothetical protein